MDCNFNCPEGVTVRVLDGADRLEPKTKKEMEDLKALFFSAILRSESGN